MSTCNRLDLETLGSQLVNTPKNLPDHWAWGHGNGVNLNLLRLNGTL